MKKVIVTGDRPTGRMHLGHYFGSLQNRVKMQHDYETYILIADVQALTDNFDNPKKIRENVRELVLDYLGAGIDPKVASIYIQSMVPEIAELTIYLSNLVTVARLYRNPTTKFEAMQKKELFGEEGSSLTYGFLGYPVSQTADILALGGEVVPVGEDQIPHIEQAREIARKFNKTYGEVFVEPEYVLSPNPRIKGLDGSEKMSKSLGNAIYLADNEEQITKKVMGAITDPNKIKKDDLANPDVCMVYYYHKLVTPKEELTKICSECKSGSRGCVACKKELVASMLAYLKPIQERRKYYEERPEEVDRILLEGTAKAQKQAKIIMAKVKDAMKIDYFKEEDRN